MEKKAGLSKFQVGVMAVAAGICVANNYYNQPILKDMADSLHTTEAKAGLITVLCQSGYGLGLFFLTPMGDKTDRKKLILWLQAALILSLLGMSFVTRLYGIYILSLAIGLLCVSAQIILPMSASLDPENKGKTVGIIFTGILIGILAARVFSGYIATWLNWRYVYGISAGLVLLSMVFIQKALPSVRQPFDGNYLLLLRSTLLQLRRFALLRRTSLLGGLIFGVFCSFWTTLTFFLSAPPFNYQTSTIGLFGLLAIGGALLAPFFGKLADKGNPAKTQVLTVVMIIAGVVLMKLFPYSLGAVLLAVLLLDIGVQATQVSNVATIYSLDHTAHSRINTVYMTAYFIGGALGTYVGVQCWKYGGWSLVTWQLLLWSVLALWVAVVSYRRSK